ncbi:MAG: agmatine deiminase family protein [Crocinitomicaceae bacterium]|nr:agmatine deiminase family protein [Crocinitomicaceae bacterium]MDG1659109.1 agmatine deiminase family protein [Crocinitomicaceae bacterium]MDG2441592.1 agmatine deiminase family protein [Crocinitomicaceae bacterium]
MKRIILAGVLLSSLLTMAQENENVQSGSLPIGLTDAEQANLRDYFSTRSLDRGIETAPGGDIRHSAQWEEIQSFLITWTGQFNTIQTQIVDAAQEECRVLIACSDSNNVKSVLSSAGVPDNNLDFLEVDYNSIWIRDYAGHNMYRNDVDSLFLVDWIYNRPRPDDDVMPEFHAAFHNIPLYSTTLSPTDLVNTGGNWMTDGLGTAFASELILEENESGNPYSVSSKTEAQIDQMVNDFMGINRYIKMPVLPYDNIHHIDMHMKLLDEETLFISEYPSGVADGPQIEANLQYVLNNFNSSFGTPYKVIRVPVPPSTGGSYPDNGGYYRTYTNSVFINKTMLVPTYREEYDTVALRILGEALPGYNIVGIDVDNSGQNLISQSGALHCITNSVGVNDPLWIVHQSLVDTYETVIPYKVSADMKHSTGISSATLYYRLATTGAYTAVTMSPAAGDSWTGDIPAQPVGTHIEYYVEGNSTNGKTTVRPLAAPVGFWDFNVIDMSASIQEVAAAISLDDVFPNPASAITCIPINSTNATTGSIILRNMTGKIVKEIYVGEIPQGESKYFLFANEFSSGAYLICVEIDSFNLTKKLMIK